MVNSRVCVDASLAVRTIIPGAFSDRATALLSRWLEEDVTLIAPALFAFEVTSTLRRLVYLDQITSTRGEEAFQTFLRLPVHLSHRRALFPLAWELAQELNRPRAYDMAYLALAQLQKCDFWTADERLYNTAHERFPRVRWIGAGQK